MGGYIMRNKWYADKRDLVKWGTMIQLCQEHKLQHIVQVAFLPPESKLPAIQAKPGRGFNLQQQVWDHFRNVFDIKKLEAKLNIKIRVMAEPFDGSNSSRRKDYIEKLFRMLSATTNGGKAVLLDPDTGIAPRSGGSSKHVTPEEVRTLWCALKPGDWLVLYQHAWRVSRSTWCRLARIRFAKACGVPVCRVRTFTSNRSRIMATDVALFAIEKPRHHHPGIRANS